jgi:hypothetical protein
LEDAKALVVEIVAWRRENRPDEGKARHADVVLGMHPDEMQFYYHHAYLSGLDNEGRPVYFERTGGIDVDGLLSLTSQDHLVDFHVYCIERNQVAQLKAASAAAGRVVD